MTKKQVLASLRSRIESRRTQCELLQDKEFKSGNDSLFEYYYGRIDSFNYVLKILCDYD